MQYIYHRWTLYIRNIFAIFAQFICDIFALLNTHQHWKLYICNVTIQYWPKSVLHLLYPPHIVAKSAKWQQIWQIRHTSNYAPALNMAKYIKNWKQNISKDGPSLYWQTNVNFIHKVSHF